MTSMLMMFDGGSVALSGGGGGGVVITTGYGRIDRLMGGGGGQYDLRFTPQTEWEQVKKKKHKKDIY